MGTLATKLVLLPPNDPESKGLVERRNGWFETSFMPGRTFTSPSDFNTQFADWLTRANARVVRNKIRLGRDYYVRLETNDYSVDPNVIGRMVDVAADLECVRVRAEGRIVAEHARVWARGMTITDPAHVARSLAAQAVPTAPRARGRR
jgi:hypothetical protein